LTGNTANSNIYTGIRLGNGGGHNTLTYNTFALNESFGMWLSDSSDNLIYNNNFIDNTTQMYGYGGSGNVFNLDAPTGGNYWSDWTGPDADNDGFVDYPYVFDAGQDYLPWTEPDGWVCDLVVDLADQVLSLNLHHGINNSLDAMLGAVLQALDDINENNDVAAVKVLEAFINAVERSSEISEEDADALIAAAQLIIAISGGA
jgi:parallel beta-helix repeat protein